MRTLWELQGIEMRKPHEEPGRIAPSILHSSLKRSAPSTAPAPKQHVKSRERRCDEVLDRLLTHCDSGKWGVAQEKQSRLFDTNRDLSKKNRDARLETRQGMEASANFLSQSFGTSQDEWRSRVCEGSWQNRQEGLPVPAFKTTISYPIESTVEVAYGAKHAHHLAGMRAKAKTTHGYEFSRGISKWGTPGGNCVSLGEHNGVGGTI